MGIVLAALPFVAFGIANGILGSARALALAATIAGLLLVRQAFRPHRSFKILEVGTFAVFLALTAYAFVAGSAISLIVVRLAIDAGLLLIAVISIAVRQPFTLQYARERVSPEIARDPGFLHRQNVLTAAWAVVFALFVVVESTMAFAPHFPARAGIGALVAITVAGFAFSFWYVARARSSAASRT